MNGAAARLPPIRIPPSAHDRILDAVDQLFDDRVLFREKPVAAPET